uniref:Secreted protein n=1 Tax=Paramormyrops kingsleyae TaxID=1676925 RepID=A0A3B3R2G4_9TELE
WPPLVCIVLMFLCSYDPLHTSYCFLQPSESGFFSTDLQKQPSGSLKATSRTWVLSSETILLKHMALGFHSPSSRCRIPCCFSLNHAPVPLRSDRIQAGQWAFIAAGCFLPQCHQSVPQ